MVKRRKKKKKRKKKQKSKVKQNYIQRCICIKELLLQEQNNKKNEAKNALNKEKKKLLEPTLYIYKGNKECNCF